MITEEQREELDTLLARAQEEPQHLSQWEQSFVDDITDRLAEWGLRLNVSPKQWSIFERIKRKLDDSGTPSR